MDPRQMRPPPASHPPDSPATPSRWRFDKSAPSDRYAAASPIDMRIPTSGLVNAPPPLPPPRYLDAPPPPSTPAALDEHDGPSILPVRPGPRARDKQQGTVGGSVPSDWFARRDMRKLSDQPSAHRRESATAPSSWSRSPTDSERRYEAMRQPDEGYYSLSGPSAPMQHLPGEKQLHREDQKKSSEAYDKGLLSRIGKPTDASSRASGLGSVESSPTSVFSFSQRQPNQFRSLSFPNSTSSSLADPPIHQEPSGRFADSPRSRPLSPRTIPAQPFTEFRSPVFEHSSRSSTAEPDGILQPTQRFPTSINISRQQKSRRSGSNGSLLSKGDDSAAGFLSEYPTRRENYDQPIFSEHDSTFRVAEDVRQLHLDDTHPPVSHLDSAPLRFTEPSSTPRSSMSRPSGTKRKLSHEEPKNVAASAAALTQQAARAQEYFNAPQQHLSAQSAAQFGHHGSISSQSSGGYRHDSYASSAGPSVGDSSYTSIDQHSPDGVSPTADPQHYTQVHAPDVQYSAMTMNPASKPPRTDPYAQPQPHPSHPSYTTPQKSQSSSRKQSQSGSQPPFECTCCTKKPKKFNTLDELNQHQNEKQYSCQWCPNKFKNKNEAERHQNSIHRRTNSWSCAELEKGEDAFFPCNSFLPMTTGGGQFQPNPPSTASQASPTDICGYCGEEFSNEPKDLEARNHHLSSLHKFGDCNRTKKFYRADHFRQHLKHSHGGKAGKHTNALEQRCSRDEPPQMSSDNSQSSTPTQAQSAPVANMGNLRPNASSTPGMAQADMNHVQMQHPDRSMRPPPISGFDMNMNPNIDPNIGYMSGQPAQPGMTMQSMQGSASSGYEYKPDSG